MRRAANILTVALAAAAVSCAEGFAPTHLPPSVKRSARRARFTGLRAQEASPSGKQGSGGSFDAKRFYVRSDRLKDVVAASVPFLLRAGSGALVHGWNIKIEKNDPARYAFFRLGDYMTVERSNAVDFARPDKPIQLYEFEGCPFCRCIGTCRHGFSMWTSALTLNPKPSSEQKSEGGGSHVGSRRGIQTLSDERAYVPPPGELQKRACRQDLRPYALHYFSMTFMDGELRAVDEEHTHAHTHARARARTRTHAHAQVNANQEHHAPSPL